jgi:hypothetical protein
MAARPVEMLTREGVGRERESVGGVMLTRMGRQTRIEPGQPRSALESCVAELLRTFSEG